MWQNLEGSGVNLLVCQHSNSGKFSIEFPGAPAFLSEYLLVSSLMGDLTLVMLSLAFYVISNKRSPFRATRGTTSHPARLNDTGKIVTLFHTRGRGVGENTFSLVSFSHMYKDSLISRTGLLASILLPWPLGAPVFH